MNIICRERNRTAPLSAQYRILNSGRGITSVVSSSFNFYERKKKKSRGKRKRAEKKQKWTSAVNHPRLENSRQNEKFNAQPRVVIVEIRRVTNFGTSRGALSAGSILPSIISSLVKCNNVVENLSSIDNHTVSLRCIYSIRQLEEREQTDFRCKLNEDLESIWLW